MFMFTLLYTLHLYSNVYFLASTFSIHSVFFVLLGTIKRSYLFCTMIFKINSFRKKSLRCFSLQKLILVQLSLKHLIKKKMNEDLMIFYWENTFQIAICFISYDNITLLNSCNNVQNCVPRLRQKRHGRNLYQMVAQKQVRTS